jgi:hypothetical protein
MNSNNSQQHLIDAEAKLSQALQRLHALRRAALYGNYDPSEFDRAVMMYREAEMQVQHAREEWARTNGGPVELAAAGRSATAEPPPEEAPPEPFEPTPRMRFVKWLVETGRLTDWIEETETAKAA